jgi:hypothetical protein
VRNPLYLGNILLWAGFAVTARLIWAAPLIAALLLIEYHLIVRWEESLLEARYQGIYRDYAAAVPRWLPSFRGVPRQRGVSGRATFSWGETLFAERGTLIAIAVGYCLLWVKSIF